MNGSNAPITTETGGIFNIGVERESSGRAAPRSTRQPGRVESTPAVVCTHRSESRSNLAAARMGNAESSKCSLAVRTEKVSYMAGDTVRLGMRWVWWCVFD